MTLILSISCSEKSELKIYQRNSFDNEFVFNYDNKLHVWRLFSPTLSNTKNTDIDSSFHNSLTEIYSGYPDTKIKYDSIHIAINLSGLSSSNGINFIANIKDDEFIVDLYFPYTEVGTYKFKLTNDENTLLNYLLNNLSLSKSGNIYLNTDTTFTVSAIYVKLFKGENSEYLFGDIYNSTKDIRIFKDFLEILIEDKIWNNNSIKSAVGYENFKIKKEFDSLAGIYPTTASPFYYYLLNPPLPSNNEKSKN